MTPKRPELSPTTTLQIKWGVGILLFLTSVVFAQESPWLPIPDEDLPSSRGRHGIRPPDTPRFLLDTPLLQAQLANAPMETLEATATDPTVKLRPCIIDLPLPDETSTRFLVTEAPVMAPALAAAYPEIKTYRVKGLDDPTLTGRIDLTPHGFHAQISSPEGQIFIDPVLQFDPRYHTAYRRSDLAKAPPRPEGFLRCLCPGCQNPEPAKLTDAESRPAQNGARAGAAPRGNALRTFRLAVTATGEFTQFHGGTVADGLAAVVTGVNRLNEVYERDLAVRLELVDNNDQVIYTNPATDPFVNISGSENIAALDSTIGRNNYDIGHNVSRAEGGLAGLGVICNATRKGDGISGDPVPINDPFWIDYVAHEIGHQFGAEHTFNSTTGGCAGGNRVGFAAYEPGSASTIMGYASLCGSDNLQNTSDAYFHAHSIDEIQSTIDAVGSCAQVTSTANQPPVVEAGSNHTIPANTPFTLTATASDGNNDSLTYCWEQFDLGPAKTLAAGDNGSSPLFRSFSPTTSPSRTFPRLQTILANTSDVQERLPTTDRTLSFRCTVRDNHPASGGTHCDDLTLTVENSAGPFRVLTGSSSIELSGPETITWEVANTDVAPVNATAVNILLSTDGGLTYPNVLAQSTPNDGSAQVVMPNLNTTTARIRVEAANNVFFDVNDANLRIVPGPDAAGFIPGTLQLDDSDGNGNNNQQPDPGETNIALTLPIQNNGNVTATSITGTLSSTTPGVTIVTPIAPYPNSPVGFTANNNSPYIISLAETFPCGDPITLQLDVTSNEGDSTLSFSLPTGTPATAQTFQFNTFTTSATPVSIPDLNATGITVPITISGLADVIADVNVTIGGQNCSSSQNATGNGINHTYIGDLIIALTSPNGTRVELLNRPQGSGQTVRGPNLCNVIFDDQNGGSSIDNITDFGGPYSGTYTPHAALSAFNGENPNGQWTFSVSDLAAQDTGDVRDLRIEITTQPTCEDPAENNPDADGDGLPDQWEIDNFGSTAPTPSADPDNDQRDNRSEYIAGTNPQDPNSYFQLIIGPDTPRMGIFATNAERYYAVEFLENIESNTWLQQGPVLQGTGGNFSFPIPDAQERKFYRIRVQLAP